MDTSELDERIASAARDGYRLATLEELLARGKHRELHRLFMQADADAPHLTAASPVSFGTWRRFVLDGPILDREASAVALQRRGAGGTLLAQRRRSVGAGCSRVHRHAAGAPTPRPRASEQAGGARLRRAPRHQDVGTANDSGNRDILALNRHLGYRRQADAYLYLREPQTKARALVLMVASTCRGIRGRWTSSTVGRTWAQPWSCSRETSAATPDRTATTSRQWLIRAVRRLGVCGAGTPDR